MIEDPELSNVDGPEAEASNPQSDAEGAPKEAASDSASGEEMLSNSTIPRDQKAENESAAEELNPIAEAERSLAEGRKQFGLKKKASAAAAAHAYIFWRECASPQADPNARDWFDREVDKSRRHVKTQNDKIKVDWKLALALEDGTLPEDHSLHKEPEGSSRRTELAKLAHLTEAEFKERRLVPIKKKDKKDENRFLAAVKLVFEMDTRADASNASRYAKVLRWVHARFKGHESPAAEQIIAAITECGFEQVIKDQRAAEPKNSKTKNKSGPSQGDMATDTNQNEESEDNAGDYEGEWHTIRTWYPKGLTPKTGLVVSLHGRFVGTEQFEAKVYETITDEQLQAIVCRLGDDASLPVSESGPTAPEGADALEDEET
ncbi:MAG: hypothetical protein KIT48_07940 [Pseudolabrys sp.]|nr:hypothetical protein [Pseudolabrys sp.]